MLRNPNEAENQSHHWYGMRRKKVNVFDSLSLHFFFFSFFHRIFFASQHRFIYWILNSWYQNQSTIKSTVWYSFFVKQRVKTHTHWERERASLSIFQCVHFFHCNSVDDTNMVSISIYIIIKMCVFVWIWFLSTDEILWWPYLELLMLFAWSNNPNMIPTSNGEWPFHHHFECCALVQQKWFEAIDQSGVKKKCTQVNPHALVLRDPARNTLRFDFSFFLSSWKFRFCYDSHRSAHACTHTHYFKINTR